MLSDNCFINLAEAGTIRMQTGPPGTIYTDIAEHVGEQVLTDQDGWAEFRCNAAFVSVWVPAGKYTEDLACFASLQRKMINH